MRRKTIINHEIENTSHNSDNETGSLTRAVNLIGDPRSNTQVLPV